MPAEPRLLIVEDDRVVREALTRLFGRHVGCAPAPTIAAARALFVEGPWSGAVVDVKLPDGDGLDFVVELRAHEAFVPVLVLTGFLEVSAANRAHSLGCDFCFKPVQQENVQRFLKRVYGYRAGLQSDLVTEVATLRDLCGLTVRETAIVRLAFGGLTHGDMALRFGVRRTTIKTEVQRLLRKAGEANLNSLMRSMMLRIIERSAKR